MNVRALIEEGGGRLETETVSWNLFASTGRVEDYLRYKGENGDFSGIENRNEEPYQRDRTSEEAVWEKPLR